MEDRGRLHVERRTLADGRHITAQRSLSDRPTWHEQEAYAFGVQMMLQFGADD